MIDFFSYLDNWESWFNPLPWKGSVGQPTVGSNPTLSATYFVYKALRNSLKNNIYLKVVL